MHVTQGTFSYLPQLTDTQVKAQVQAYFADLAPPDVSLSDEIIRDRRAEHERD